MGFPNKAILIARKPQGGGAGGATAALTSGAGSSLRNDFGNLVGFSFTVGASPLYVKSLGRWKVSGNSGSHVVKVINSSLTTVASATINMTSGSAGSYVYVALGSSVTLSAGASYMCMSTEVVSGDQWYDGFAVTTSADIAIGSSVYFDIGTGTYPTVNGGCSYVPPNFLYDLTP